MVLISTFGKAITTTAVSMSTNSAAIGMTITGSPIPVTDLAIDPMTTAANTIASSVPFTPAVCPVPAPAPHRPSFHVCDKNSWRPGRHIFLSQTWIGE